MAHEGVPVEGDPQLLAGNEDQPDARIDHIDGELAEQERAWETDWDETLKDVKRWGPRLAKAYRDAREEVGGTVSRQYDGEGDPIGFTPAEAKAFAMQPDVLIVDLSMHDRSLRHPLPGDVSEKVFAAGWTILRREYPAPEGTDEAAEEDAADAEPKPKKAAKRTLGLLDELVEIDAPVVDDAEDTDEAAEPVARQNMLVERIVVIHDGRIIRFEGRSDANPEGEGPLRFARVKPNEDLRDEDDSDNEEGDDKGLSKYEKQKKQLEDYRDDNDDHFVSDRQFAAVELLAPGKMLKAKLNSLPQDAPEGAEDHELQAGMVRDGLAQFLEDRDLATPDYLADLRS